MFVLAGMTAGLAAWTKEEGWLLLVTILIARGIVLILGKGEIRRTFQEILLFFSGYPISVIILSNNKSI